MRAMLLHKPRPIEEQPLVLTELPEPEPGPGQVRLRVEVCGVCHTDLHTVEGDLPLPKLPLIPGHQVVGIVDAVGEGVARVKVGDRVGVPWLYHTCGSCRFCRNGQENLCEKGRFTGYHVDGGYAEFMVAEEDFVCPLPPELEPVKAAPLLCAGIIGYRALKLSGIKPGGKLGLYGFGASAHLAIQVATYWGCEVFVFSRGAHHRELARELGAVWTGTPQESPPEKLDSSIIFAPAGWLVPLALEHLDKGGVLVLAGITMTDIPQLKYELLYHERVVCSVANATRQDAREFLALAAVIPVKTTVETFPLEEANEALQKLKAGKINGAGVLVIG
ncbi:zinc-binding alcohol dehydrogenase family protein [Ammonifex degensii KC4]|uniref:alcohol dehydrogenase n=1 Tax=Ammonifex degensii (strain DSM 10501 / KC4) TaxID=429009 RepID=C9R7M4_AMMDK|nr:zinc-binding alcohol dehydrogenase family protein [Ammonifex degensii KC4]